MVGNQSCASYLRTYLAAVVMNFNKVATCYYWLVAQSKLVFA